MTHLRATLVLRTTLEEEAEYWDCDEKCKNFFINNIKKNQGVPYDRRALE